MDASAAIDVLKVSEDDNKQRQQLCKALIRRGAALAQLGLEVEAEAEFEAAQQLWPGKKDDVRKIRDYMLTEGKIKQRDKLET